MTEMPKKIWAADVQYEGARRRTWRRTPGTGQSTPYVRGDIADAMLDLLKSEGMTLRDWFAGQALTRVDWHTLDYQAARQCYDMADAMLAEREKSDDD